MVPPLAPSEGSQRRAIRLHMLLSRDRMVGGSQVASLPVSLRAPGDGARAIAGWLLGRGERCRPEGFSMVLYFLAHRPRPGVVGQSSPARCRGSPLALFGPSDRPTLSEDDGPDGASEERRGRETRPVRLPGHGLVGCVIPLWCAHTGRDGGDEMTVRCVGGGCWRRSSGVW